MRISRLLIPIMMSGFISSAGAEPHIRPIIPKMGDYVQVSEFIEVHCEVRRIFIQKSLDNHVSVTVDDDFEEWMREVSIDYAKISGTTVIGEIPNRINCE